MSAETDADASTDMSAEMEARADAIAYAHAPSIEAHLYNDYINLETGSSTDIWAEGQAQMDAWANELQESIEAAKADNTATITDTNFLEMDNEGEASTEASSSLSSEIEQQMDAQLEGQIRVMSEQEIEEQAAIAEMLDADAADAAAEGEDLNLSLLESSSSTSTSSSSTSDLELQAHMDIHEGLRDAMNSKEGMEIIAELEQERVREEALQHAEQWLQGYDHIALETGTDTETGTETETDTEATVDTEVDATTKAQTLTAQLQAQEARIWATLSTEQKMHARASMAIDTIISHTMEIHAMNEAASMILDHLISDGYLHEGMEESETVDDGNETDVEETKVEETRPRPVTLTSCSLSASNHLRAPSHTCTCPSPSILVHCTTHADISYHTTLQDTIDRIHTLRTLVSEIQSILDKSKRCMLQVEEHMELLRDGVGHGLHVEHEALVDTLSEAMQQLTSYEKTFYQSVEIQAWTCISQDTTRKLKGAKGTIKGAVVQAC